jgi:hypothetical protein
MNFAEGVGSDGAAFQAAAVDPLLDRDVRLDFELEVPLLRILAVELEAFA